MNRIISLLLAGSLCAGSCILSAQPLNRKPIKVFGHARNIATSTDSLAVDTASPNLVEGRELSAPQGIAVDTAASPHILYVSDTANHRVLAWRNATGFSNGAQADLIIGQKDRFSTPARGPGSAFSTGLTSPTGLAVDRAGNLYVADTGNNRILRYPRPFEQPAEGVTPTSVIGQSTFSTDAVNSGGVSEKSLAFNLGGNTGILRAGLTFDSNGNLLVTDPGNNRVLRFPVGSLEQNHPSADLVLGQQSFASRVTTTNRLEKTLINKPSGVAVDPGGRVFVTDFNNRALVYAPPLSSGIAAARIMGVPTQIQGQPAPAAVSEYTLGGRINNVNVPPEGVVIIGNRPAVLDTTLHRILIYDPFEQWPAESVTFSPPARTVVGQGSFSSTQRHRGASEPAANTLLGPTAAIAIENDLYVADTGNNRVVALPAGSGTFASASRLLGQIDYRFNSPNLVEGRELFTPLAMVIDSSVRPHRLYVADANNNRVLGYRDYLKYRTGERADIVIGQPDFFSAKANHPSNDPTQPSDVGLNSPQGLAIDSEGNLWVTDTFNGRVLRFPKPFDQPAGATQRANLVVGQANFTSQLRDPGQRSMRAPVGIVLSLEGADVNHSGGVLIVTDNVLNRALIFQKPFSNGMAASRVLGQPDFTSSAAGAGSNRMDAPRHVAIDTDDRLYVADTDNRRILIFDRIALQPDQANAAVILQNTTGTDRLNSPYSVSVSPHTGEIWVADNSANLVYRYPQFNLLTTSNFQANFSLPSAGPLGVLSDPFTNLMVADSYHRVAYFAPEVVVQNAATYFRQAFAPGTIVSIFPSAPGVFGSDTQARNFDQLPQPIPLPRELSDLQVMLRTDPLAEPFAGSIFYSSGQQINMPLPMSLPETGRVELQVIRPSTGQIFGVADIVMSKSSPGFFTAGATGAGQIAALNQDNTLNSASNPIARGQVVQLFGTGQGFVPDAPPDGELTQGTRPARDTPFVIVGTREVTPEYSGLAPGLIGVWQINLRIPDATAPSNTIPVVVTFNSVPSNLDPTANRRIVTTIAVKQ